MTIYIVHDESETPTNLINQGGFTPVTHTEMLNQHKNDLIIQWGVGPYSFSSSEGWVLNGVEGLKNGSEEHWRGVLSTHGLNIAQDRQSFQKKYIVYVFQLEVIGIYSEQSEVWLSNTTKGKGRYREVRLDNNRLEIRKVKRLAVRSIHSLGLDFGMVVIGVYNGEQYVLQVSPKPRLFPKMLNRFTRAIHSLEQKLKTPINAAEIILGADPEFVLRNKNGKFVLASSYFNKGGTVGCDQIWLRGDKTKKKLPIVELRPAPSKEPNVLVRNIYRGLLAASKKINNSNIQFLAGSLPLKGYPIGGHIHFSNTYLNSFFLRALDNYLALPLFLLEDPDGFMRRPRYGFVGDYREQFHGGFEYRALPSWLVSPRITKGVLALAKVVACSYPDLRKVPFTNPSIQQAFYNGDQNNLLDVIGALWNDLEHQSIYQTYRTYLDPLKESILNLERWNESLDIRPRWRIPPFDRS